MRLAGPAPFGLTWFRVTRYILPGVALLVAGYTLCGAWLGVRVAREMARLGLDETVTEPPEVAAARTELVEAMAWLAEIPWPEGKPFGVPYMLVPEHAADLEAGVAERGRFYATIDRLPDALWQVDGAPLPEPGGEPVPLMFVREATLALGARAWTRARLHGDLDGAGRDLARALALLRVLDDASLGSLILRRAHEGSVLLVAKRILEGSDFDAAPLVTAIEPELERSLHGDRCALLPQVEVRQAIAWQHYPIEEPSWIELWMARPFLRSLDLELIALYECLQAGQGPPRKIARDASRALGGPFFRRCGAQKPSSATCALTSGRLGFE